MLLRHEGFRRLCEARDLLRDVSDDDLTIARIASTVGMSRAHFIVQFEALFGVTPHQYRIQARLDRARELLTGSDRPVTDVCLEVGFTSLGSFSSLFTRRVGVSPSVYRRRCRTSASNDNDAEVSPAGCLTLLARLPGHPTSGEASSRAK